MAKERTDAGRKRLILFACLLVVGAIAILAYACFTGNTDQVYSDIVNEYTAMWGSNKSAERSMFYLFSVAGAVAYAACYLSNSKVRKADDVKTVTQNRFVITGLAVSCVVSYVVWSSIHWLVIAGLLLVAAAQLKAKDTVTSAAAFLFICSYAICALYRLYVFCGGNSALNFRHVSLISLILAVGILAVSTNSKIYHRGIMICQLFIPFSMLITLSSTYKYGDNEYTKIHTPRRIQVLIILIILFFLIEAVCKIYKHWKSAADFQDILAFGTCVSIMSFNRFSGSGSIISPDLHHPFENIISYSQMAELGQKAFSQYIPVSGMFSFVHGFFFAFFGKGQAAFYAVSSNVFYLSVIFVIVFLLRRQLKAEWVLFVSLMFMVNDYNRHVLMVPAILLLAWPKLIERKNLWLKAWFLTSYLQGLYYPVFGAAVCVAFAPMGIWQICSYVKSGELSRDIRTIKFWIFWIVCFVPVLCGSKLLIGTAKHMMAMSSQTVMADGIARFGQTIPGGFFSYIGEMPIRTVLYYLFSFLIVISIVWVSAALFFTNGKVHVSGRKVRIDDPVGGNLSLLFGLMMLVSFSYTVIRLDINSVYARNMGVVYACFVVLVLLIGRHMNGHNANTLWVFGFAVFILSAVQAEGFLSMSNDPKCEAFYTVPPGYVHVVDDRVERLGECFVEENCYNRIEETYESFLDLDRNKTYLGKADHFGLFYLNGVKADSVVEMLTIKGFEAAQETVDLIRNNSTIIGTNMSSINNYYLYHWLITSGEYVWDFDSSSFVPNDGSLTKNEILMRNKNYEYARDGVMLSRTAGSWGKSMDSLGRIFTGYETDYAVSQDESGIKIHFDQEVKGEDADFLYIEFANMTENFDYIQFNHQGDYVVDMEEYGYAKALFKKDYNRGMNVIFKWMDDMGIEHSMGCSMDAGKLLLPLGGGRGWLLNNHSDLRITVMQEDQITAVPEIADLRLLKVREVS